MGRSIYSINGGLVALGLVACGCTAVLGIDKDYREASGGGGAGSR